MESQNPALIAIFVLLWFVGVGSGIYCLYELGMIRALRRDMFHRGRVVVREVLTPLFVYVVFYRVVLIAEKRRARWSLR